MTSDLPRSSSSSIIYRAGLGRIRRVMAVFRRDNFVCYNIWCHRFQCNWNARTKYLTCSTTKLCTVQYRSRTRRLSHPARLQLLCISAVGLHTRLLIWDVYLTPYRRSAWTLVRGVSDPSIIQLAVFGPRSKVKYWVTTEFLYQTIKGDR